MAGDRTGLPFLFPSLPLRAAAFLCACGLLAALCRYSYLAGRAEHEEALRLLSSPSVHAGARIDISYGKVRDVNDRGTTLQFKTCWVNVRPPIPGSRPGDIISVEGAVASDTSLTPLRIHFHRGQGFKLYISIAALAVFTVLFFRSYRWDFREWAFRERTDA